MRICANRRGKRAARAATAAAVRAPMRAPTEHVAYRVLDTAPPSYRRHGSPRMKLRGKDGVSSIKPGNTGTYLGIEVVDRKPIFCARLDRACDRSPGGKIIVDLSGNVYIGATRQFK